jgi:hypothetical protein
MKKRFIKAIFVCSIIFSASLSVTAQVYVKMRPAVVVVPARPVQPGPTYIWVGEDWLLDGNGYKYSGGYWEKPRAGYYRKTGYWKHDNRGHRWVPAGWVKQELRGKGKWNGKGKGKGKKN